MAKLARAMRAQVSTLGKAIVEVMMPLYPPALEALETAGYHIEMDPRRPEEVREHGVDIFELWLNQAA